VVSVLPSAAEIPENVLRFYVSFSEPMREGDFLSHVRLERVDTGEDLTGVFFDNLHELWSADRTRITLLVDPGRVKQGLAAHAQLGRAFEAGGAYRLHIADTWRSTRGVPLVSTYVHDFGGGPADASAVTPSDWCLSLPVGSTDPVTVRFGEPVDHVSVHRLIRVVDPEGVPLEGRWVLGDAETHASWTPDRPWVGPVGAHRLVVSGRFEDIAGNNLNAAFEHAPGAVGAEGTTAELRFDEACRAR
jgi:hypothetical protein